MMTLEQLFVNIFLVAMIIWVAKGLRIFNEDDHHPLQGWGWAILAVLLISSLVFNFKIWIII